VTFSCSHSKRSWIAPLPFGIPRIPRFTANWSHFETTNPGYARRDFFPLSARPSLPYSYLPTSFLQPRQPNPLSKMAVQRDFFTQFFSCPPLPVAVNANFFSPRGVPIDVLLPINTPFPHPNRASCSNFPRERADAWPTPLSLNQSRGPARFEFPFVFTQADRFWTSFFALLCFIRNDWFYPAQYHHSSLPYPPLHERRDDDAPIYRFLRAFPPRFYSYTRPLFSPSLWTPSSKLSE